MLETLLPTVDDIKLVKTDGMYNLLALLKLTLGRSYKLGGSTNRIIVTRTTKATTKLADLTRCLVNPD